MQQRLAVDNKDGRTHWRRKDRQAASDGGLATKGGGAASARPTASGSEAAHVGDGKAAPHGRARPPPPPPALGPTRAEKARAGAVEGADAGAARP